ncbi:MAG: hypothetical protein IJC99_00500 [Clostridia bacterium]|nr:hypothetical protein [Clostridia bacterium]
MKKKQNIGLSTKILAIVLCVLMVVTLAFTSIYMLVNLFKPEEEEPKTEAAIVEVVEDYTC